MSYNLTATIHDITLLAGPYEDGIWSTVATELLDSVLSGQNYSQAHYNYERTYNGTEVLRDQIMDVVENNNKAYLQLLAFATQSFLDQLPELISHSPHDDETYYDKWQAIKDAHASSNFTVDELIALEPLLSVDLEEAPSKIGAYEPLTLQVIIGFISRMRAERKFVDADLRHIDFDMN